MQILNKNTYKALQLYNELKSQLIKGNLIIIQNDTINKFVLKNIIFCVNSNNTLFDIATEV